jgi:hypothetical protein
LLREVPAGVTAKVEITIPVPVQDFANGIKPALTPPLWKRLRNYGVVVKTMEILLTNICGATGLIMNWNGRLKIATDKEQF